MPLLRSQIFQGVRSILWVDSNSPFEQEYQTGSIEKPYSTIQQAIDHGANDSAAGWHINVAFGSYASDPLTIPPEKDFIIEGRVRRGSMQTGNITWTVTGTTSSVAFRRIVAGNITIVDGVSPATAATLSYVDSECRGINVTGSSYVIATLGGVTLASFQNLTSGVASMAVSQSIELGNGLLLAHNTQFQNTCSFINTGSMFVAGCNFNQDINLTGTDIELGDSSWNTAHTITFTGSSGLVTADAPSIALFVDSGGQVVNGSIQLSDQRSTGWLSGGSVTRDSGRTVNITAGSGYIFSHGDVTSLVTWASGSYTLPANLLSDIYVDITGSIMSTPHPSNHRNGILLATAQTNATEIVALSQEHVETSQIVAQMSEYTTKLFGALHVGGLITQVYSPPSLQLEVDAGSYYNGIHFCQTTATAPITFTSWYRNGSGGWSTVSGQTAIDSNFYDDGSGTLSPLTAGQWKKDILFVSQNDTATEYHLIYAQEIYSSEEEAASGNIPTAPDAVLSTSLRLAGLVVEGASSEVSVVIDLKPKLGQLSSGSTAVTDHGLLSGLSDDDHLQYQLRTEKNQANGYAGLSGSSKLNGAQQTYGTASNTSTEGNDARIPTQSENDALQGTNGSPSNTNRYVTDSDPRNSDPRTPTAHATTHLPSGADPITTATAVDIGTSNTTGSADSLSRSDHGHNLPFSTVQTVLGSATGSISVNNHQITNLASPTLATDAANKAYVDSITTGLQWKQPVKVATNTPGTLASSFEDGDIVDGITLTTGDRILIKDQTAQEENGIYIVNASGAPTRSTDMDSWSKVPNAAVFVEQGTVNADNGFVCTSNAGGTLDTTAITFIQFSSISAYVGGNGISVLGNTISLVTPVSIANGGTNSTASLNNNRIIISSGGSIIEASAIIASRALASDANGIPVAATATTSELNFLSGVTSAIQTQLNNKQPLDATLTSLAAYNTNGILVQTNSDTFIGRTIGGTAGNIIISNGDGVAGNPSIDLATVSQGTGGSFIKVTIDGFGRVTQNTPVTSSDITTVLGFTPATVAGSDTQVQYNNSGSFGADPAFTFTQGANPFVSIIGTTATNQLRVGGSASIGTSTMYLEANNANQDGLRAYFNSGSPATSGIIAYAYSGSQPYIRVVDADDDPTYINFEVIGGGTESSPAISNRFGGRGPNAGATTGFSWYVNGTEIAQLDSNYLLPPAGTTLQRPTPVVGMYRYNTSLGIPEMYFKGDWQPVFSSGGGGYNSIFDDFQTEVSITTSFSVLGWTGSNSGTGSSITDVNTGTSGSDKAIGVIQLTTGTTSTGRSGIGKGNNSILFGNSYHYQEWRIQIPTLSTGGQQYSCYIGFGDTYNASGDVTDGAYFEYDQSTSSNWRICTANNSTRSKTTTTTTVTSGTWVKLGIEVNEAGSTSEFFINNVSVGTISTNIPTSAGRNFGYIAKIQKSSGNTARQLLIDYFKHLYIYTTPR